MYENLFLKWMFLLLLFQISFSQYIRPHDIRLSVGVITEHDDSLTVPAIRQAISRFGEIRRSSVRYIIQVIDEQVNFNDVAEMDRAVCRLLNKGIHAMFSKTNVLSYQILSSYANEYQIPLFSPSVPDVSNDLHSQFVFGMQPQTVRAIIALIRDYPWEDIYYLYDDENGPGKLQKIFQLGYNVHQVNLLGLLKVSHAEQANRYLRKLQSAEKNRKFYIILDVEPSLAQNIIIRHIHDVHIGKENFHFLVTNMVLNEFWATAFTNTNVTGFAVFPNATLSSFALEDEFHSETWNNAKHETKISAYFFFDAALLLAESFKTAISRSDLEISRFNINSRIPGNNDMSRDCLQERPVSMPLGRTLIKIIKDQIFVANTITGTMAFDEFNIRSNLTFAVIESSPTGYKTIGYWSRVLRKTDNENGKQTEPTALRQRDNSKKYFRIGSMLSPPFLMLRSGENNTHLENNDRYEGFVKDLIDFLAQELNFDYEIVLSEDGTQGNYDEMKGHWTGIIGDIIRGKVDIAVADLQVTARRQRVVDFLTDPISSTSLSILMKNPTTMDSSLSFYMLASFNSDVWICIIVFAIIVIALFHTMSSFTGSPDNIEATAGIWGKKFTAMSSIWFILGSSVMHGTGIYPRSASCRILGGAWWCFTLIILSFFIANTTTRIFISNTDMRHNPQLSRLLSLPLESVIKESVKNNWPHLGILRESSSHDFIQVSNIPAYKSLNNYFRTYPSYAVDDINYGVQKVRNSMGGYAFIMESLKSDYYSQEGPCNTISIHDTVNHADYGIAVPLGSYIRYDLNQALRKLKDQGRLSYLHNKWWINNLFCDPEIPRNYAHQDLKTLSGVFFVGFIGLGLAGLVGVSQYFWKAYKKEEKRQRLSFEEVAMNQPLPLPPPELLTDTPMDEDNGVIDGWSERKLVPTSFSKESRRFAANEESGVR